MDILLWIIVFLTTFFFMEFMAWFTHKYVMHGFLWSLHKDHHKKDHDSWFERNDAFYALFLGIFQVGIGLILYTAGSKTVPAAELTLLSLCEVLLAPIWVWIFLGEGATRLTFIGGFILLIAIILNSIFLIIKRDTKKTGYQ